MAHQGDTLVLIQEIELLTQADIFKSCLFWQGSLLAHKSHCKFE